MFMNKTFIHEYFLLFLGHLPQKQQDYRKRYRTLASTYLTFSPDGRELLVNLGGEQIYLFDINKRRGPQKFDLPLIQNTNGVVKGEERKCMHLNVNDNISIVLMGRQWIKLIRVCSLKHVMSWVCSLRRPVSLRS